MTIKNKTVSPKTDSSQVNTCFNHQMIVSEGRTNRFGLPSEGDHLVVTQLVSCWEKVYYNYLTKFNIDSITLKQV